MFDFDFVSLYVFGTAIFYTRVGSEEDAFGESGWMMVVALGSSHTHSVCSARSRVAWGLIAVAKESLTVVLPAVTGASVDGCLLTEPAMTDADEDEPEPEPEPVDASNPMVLYSLRPFSPIGT